LEKKGNLCKRFTSVLGGQSGQKTRENLGVGTPVFKDFLERRRLCLLPQVMRTTR